jgi:hypothetical protein
MTMNSVGVALVDGVAEEMQRAERLLGGEVPVRHQSDEEGRRDGRDGVHRVRPEGERPHAVIAHVHGNGGVPRTPDEELEEHHRAEARTDGFHEPGVERRVR